MKGIANCLWAAGLGWGILSSSLALAQSPQSLMKPLGAPSAVDRYRSPVNANPSSRRFVETAAQVRPAATANAGYEVRPAQFTIPPSSQPLTSPPNNGTLNVAPGGGGGLAPPPAGAAPANPQTPRTAPPAMLPNNPALAPGAPSAAPTNVPPNAFRDDLAPVNQPRLGGVQGAAGRGAFATLNNSCQVTGPSGYSAAMAGGGCAPVGFVQPTGLGGTPPNPFANSATIPSIAPISSGVVSDAAPAGALLTFGQETNPVQVGQGVIGQPKAYVPGQPIRNWLRYLTP